MDINPICSYNVDYFIDADFSGLWNSENDQYPVCVKSRTSVVIMLMCCPLMWIRKLQTQISLSTIESDYIVLSHSMKKVVGI